RCGGPAAAPSRRTQLRRTQAPGAPAPPAENQRSDELQKHHLGRVRSARPELENPGVPAGPLGVARGDLLEQLVDRELVLTECRQRLPAGVEIALLGQRDQLLDLGLDRLGLRLTGPNALVVDDLLDQVHQQRLAVRGASTELITLALVTHGRDPPGGYSLRRPRPRACRVSTTSSIDFLPKLGIALSSDSVFDTRSPTVWIPARLRQLYERTPSSSSSIRMSSSALGCRAGAPPAPPPTSPGSSAPGAPCSRSSITRSASVKIASCEIRISAA